MSLVLFDLETGNADLMWQAHDPDYVRLMAYRILPSADVLVTSDHDVMRTVLTEATALIGHNCLQFDCLAAARHLGLDVHDLIGKSKDTLVLARLVWPAPHPHGLDYLGRRYLGAGKQQFIHDDKVITAKKPLDGYAKAWNRTAKLPDPYRAIPVDDEQYRRYAAQDVALLGPLAEAITSHPLFDARYAERETAIARVAAGITWRGIALDPEGADRAQAAEDRIFAEAKANLVAAGIEFDKRLGDKGREALHQILTEAGFTNLPVTEKSGKPTSSVKELREHGIDHPLLDELELVNTCRGLASQARKYADPDGICHPSNQAGQRTGRWSVTRPALTTFGKRSERLLEQRSIFRPRPGHVFVSIDYSAVDIRAMAWASRDPAMIASLQPGKDFHADNAEAFLGDRGKRKQAKPLGHAIDYNAGPATVAAFMQCPEEEASEAIWRMKEKFHVLEGFKNGEIAKATAPGSSGIIANGLGRWMQVDRDRAHTQCPGLIGQSVARDVIMRGMLNVADEGLAGLIALHVHDEFVIEVAEGDVDDVVPRIVAAMEFTSRGVPFLVEAGPPAGNWRDCYRGEA